MMVRKRGSFDRIEKVVNKKRTHNHTDETANESPVKKDRNMLNDHILSLYKKEAAALSGESSFSNSNSVLGKTEMPVSDVKNEQSENGTPATKATRKSMKKKNIGFSVEYPNITFDDVAGLDDISEKMLRIYVQIKDAKVSAALKREESKHILLHGPSGCGKTHVVQALAGETGLPLLQVKATQLVCGVSGESESRIRDVFEEAQRIAPCILFIDKFETIGSKYDPKDSKGLEKRMAIQLQESLDAFKQNDNSFKVMVIAATTQLDSIAPSLLSKFRFKLEVRIPNEKARLMILQALTKKYALPPDFDLEWLANHTPGYVGADLYNLVQNGLDLSVDRMYDRFLNKHFESEKCDSITNSPCQPHSNTIFKAVRSYCKSELEFPIEDANSTIYTLESFQEALKHTIPISKSEGFCMVPSVTWEDVGALKDVKEDLQETIIWPVKYRKLFEKGGLGIAKGVLLYGPKGCGKTLLAKVIANECRINFLSVKGPELLNMYLGESEKAVRQCFARARNSAPCVIFFDEMDALCPERSSSNSNAAAERVVNMLLTEMDGIEERNEVFVIGATNRLDKIDSAMLRPGRLEKVIYIGLPVPDDRVDILKSLTKNKTKPKIADDVDLNMIGHDPRCNNFSGADLAHLIRAATADAIKEIIKSSSSTKLDEEVEIKLKNFEHAFSVVKPSVTEKDIKYFQQLSGQRC